MATLTTMVKAPLSALFPASPSTQQGGTRAALPCDALRQSPVRLAGLASKPPGAPQPVSIAATTASVDADTQPPGDADSDEAVEPVEEGSRGPSGLNNISAINLSLLSQACELGLWHIAKTTPSVGEWVTRIRQSTSNYSLWLVPGLYAALGALIFFMRQILDDDRDNPTLDMIFLRIAIAGMAGIVVGWIWNPTASADTRSIGATLFIVSFAVGYSIEVFFTNLDRLVVRTTGALNRQIEESGAKQTRSAEPAAPAADPPQEPKPTS
jgi:hypothetical protein